jgi:hypothetical protein
MNFHRRNLATLIGRWNSDTQATYHDMLNNYWTDAKSHDIRITEQRTRDATAVQNIAGMSHAEACGCMVR